MTGGDVISVARVRRALELLPGCQLIHAYGPTETTTFATCHPVAAVDVERPTLTPARRAARRARPLRRDAAGRARCLGPPDPAPGRADPARPHLAARRAGGAGAAGGAGGA